MTCQTILVLRHVVGTILLANGLRAVPEKAADTRADLQGEWGAVSFSGDWDTPDVPSRDTVKMGKLVLRCQGFSRYEFQEGKVTWESTWTSYRVDAAAKPKAIDFVLSDGESAELVSRGIYELKGDTLRICRTIKLGGERPMSFAAEKGSGRELSAWKRKKP